MSTADLGWPKPDPGRPITWDPVRLREDLAQWLRTIVPDGLEVGLVDHGKGIGIVRAGELVETPEGHGHFGLIAAPDPTEPMTHIAGRVRQTLHHVGLAVSQSVGRPWPTALLGRESGTAFAFTNDRVIRCGWAAVVDHASQMADNVSVELRDLFVHPVE